jgi:hypothetical protein
VAEFPDRDPIRLVGLAELSSQPKQKAKARLTGTSCA